MIDLLDERVITYERVFILESCHMNGRETYNDYREALRLLGLPVDRPMTDRTNELLVACKTLLRVLADIHGHNFRVKVIGTRKVTYNDHYVVVWDEELDKLVNEWNRTNLSVHPDFQGYRATTEVMAALLKKKLEKKWDDVFWSVEVEENRDIRAVAS